MLYNNWYYWVLFSYTFLIDIGFQAVSWYTTFQVLPRTVFLIHLLIHLHIMWGISTQVIVFFWQMEMTVQCQLQFLRSFDVFFTPASSVMLHFTCEFGWLVTCFPQNLNGGSDSSSEKQVGRISCDSLR